MSRSESNSVEVPSEGVTMDVVMAREEANPAMGLKAALETAASLPHTAPEKNAEPMVSLIEVSDKSKVSEACETGNNKKKFSDPNKTESVSESEQNKSKPSESNKAETVSDSKVKLASETGQNSAETASKQDTQVGGPRTDDSNTEVRSGSEVDVEALSEHVLGILRDGGEPAALLQQNADLQLFITRLIGLLREKTELCANLDRQNSALISQAKSLRDVIAITKDLLGIRNMEVEHLHADLAAMEDSIKEERARHNTAVERLNQAMGLNNELKKEYLNQMDLFQKLRDKYNEKVVLLTRENQRLKGIEPQTSEEDPTAKSQTSEDTPAALPLQSQPKTCILDPSAQPQTSEDVSTALSLQPESKSCLVDPIAQTQTCLVERTAQPLPSQQDQNIDK